MFCGKCGTKNERGSNFCEQCGARLEVPHQEEARQNFERVEPFEYDGNRQRVGPAGYDDTEIIDQEVAAEYEEFLGYNDESIEYLKPPKGYREPVKSQGAYQEVHEDFSSLEGEKKKNKKPLMIIMGILLLVVIAVAGWLFTGFQNTRAFNDSMDQAHRYLLAENLDQAEAYFLRAIEINPREPEPYLRLADIYIEWDEPERAIEILEQGRQAVPEAQRPAFDIAISDIPVTAGGEPPANEGDGVGVEDGEELPFEVIWVLAPSIEADDIDFIKSRADVVQNNNFRHFSSRYAVIRRGDTFGLIDDNGVIKEGMYFANVFMVAGTYGLALIEGREYDEFYPLIIGGYMLENGEFTPLLPMGPDGFDVFMFYYFEGLQNIFLSAYGSPPQVGMPSVPIPVRIANRIFVSSNEDMHGDNWYREQTGLFGVFYQGQMLTDFIYTQIGSYSEGLLAVERDGRWGYINRNGEIIIPIEYDASLIDRVYDWREGAYVDRAFAYAASEGFIPLVRDGIWEMRTTTGELVIEPGRFEAIRPMVGGRSWVKQDGLWGIIEIVATDEEVGEENAEAAGIDEDWRELIIQYIRDSEEELPGLPFALTFMGEDEKPILLRVGSPASAAWSFRYIIGFHDGELVFSTIGTGIIYYIPEESTMLSGHTSAMSAYYFNDAGVEGRDSLRHKTVSTIQNGEMIPILRLMEREFFPNQLNAETTITYYRVLDGPTFEAESITEAEYNRLLSEAFDMNRAREFDWELWMSAEEMIEKIMNL